MKKPNSKKQYCAERSKVKVLIYLKSGAKETFYSYFKEEKKGIPQVMSGMYKRLVEDLFKRKFTCALFYDNQTGEELARYDYYGHKIETAKNKQHENNL